MTAVLAGSLSGNDASDVYRRLLAASGLPTEVPTPPRMPYRPEAELKRPDLKGEFVCATCKKTFCHAASLNRHRLNFHGGNHFCTQCNDVIQPKETVRRHMSVVHNYDRIFTCGCCNWAFPDKKELHIHTSSMAKTNTPGSAKAIAITSSANGEGPAIGVFKEPKKVRDARLAFKAAAAAAAAANAAARPAAADGSHLQLSPPQQQTTLLPSCSMPAALLPQGNLYAQLLAQLMATASAAPNQQSAWLRALTLNNPLLNVTCSPEQQQSHLQHHLQQPLQPLDTSSLLLAAGAAASSSGLPSTSRSEAQDTESDRATSPHSPPSSSSTSEHHHHDVKPLDISSLLSGSSAGVVQFANKTPLSPSLAAGLSLDDCSSSPSSSSSSPLYDDKFSMSTSSAVLAAAAAAVSGQLQHNLQHSIAALISPDKSAKDSCSSSSSSEIEASSPEAARQTPSPSSESRKRPRTLNDVVSFLQQTKKCKEEDE